MDQEKEEKMASSDGNQTKRVQDLAETGNGSPPPRYIQVESSRPSLDPPPCTIPVVDLSRLLQPEEGAKLRSALHSWGLFQAVGHGIPSSLLDEVRNITKLFFQQPMQDKQMYYSTGLEGYGNDKIASSDQILDWSDRLYLQVQPEQERKMELWPEIPVSFRETLHEYSGRTRTMLNVILKALAELLGLEEDYFTGHIGEKATAFARFNYYPRCSRPDLVFGLKPHADGSVLTIVLQDPDVEGLQVLNRFHGWVKVPIIPNALLVNMGDQMEIMSNGEYKSPIHRVVTSSEKERISVALFYSGEMEREIEPAIRLVGEGKPRLYKKVKVKEYIELFSQHFYQGKMAIDWAKI